MIVDVARSCSVRPFWFFSDPNPHTPASHLPMYKVRWYWAPDGAKTLPFPTIFASSDFCDRWEKAEVDVGEIPRYEKSRVQGGIPGIVAPTWDDGAAPAGATGQGYCGKPSDFLIPKIYDPSRPPMVLSRSGLPVCCNPLLLAGGALVDGESTGTRIGGVAGEGKPVFPLGGVAGEGKPVFPLGGVAGEGKPVFPLGGVAGEGKPVFVLGGAAAGGQAVFPLGGAAAGGQAVFPLGGAAAGGQAVFPLGGAAAGGQAVFPLGGVAGNASSPL